MGIFVLIGEAVVAGYYGHGLPSGGDKCTVVSLHRLASTLAFWMSGFTILTGLSKMTMDKGRLTPLLEAGYILLLLLVAIRGKSWKQVAFVTNSAAWPFLFATPILSYMLWTWSGEYVIDVVFNIFFAPR